MTTETQVSQTPAKPITNKEKTKAKKRYLKAKKDRRKRRKSVPGLVEKAHSGLEDEDELEDVALPEVPATEEHAQAGPSSNPDARPHKKRKVADPGLQDPEENVKQASPEDDLASLPSTSKPVPTIINGLPSFPAPRRPDAPSKKTLALQGLDTALAGAELIEPSTVLPIVPDEEDEDGTGLSRRMKKRLRELSVTELFAVQTAVIPMLLSNPRQRQLYLPHGSPRDLCVSAPTGSGKTLAYVVPIIEILSHRTVTRLRALVVLPTRDLVMQVRETFEAVGKGRGLKIGMATGQHSFAHEQAQLIADQATRLQGGSSRVDILICTPGRLIDHLAGTPNFSLQHLRYLVIDEADRLLAQSFQDWLVQVLAATRPTAISDVLVMTPPSLVDVPAADALAPAHRHLLRGVSHIHTDLDEKTEPTCQKLLFSATLTRDPAKIASLHLNNPRYLIVQSTSEKASPDDGVLNLVMEKFTMPASLSEHMIVCDSAQKPLMLFYLVHKHGVSNALIFTKSAESTNRLVRLFDFFESALASEKAPGHQPKVLQAYSSELGAADRKSILERFKSQEVNILVCSDLISRGIDISHVSHVVSYDAPVDMRKYVHRVGRTARAGRAGDAWTLVEEQEARYFKALLNAADHLDAVKRLRVVEKDVASLLPSYERALGQLKEVYAR
ncbi:ATP-dependent RNA helicase dbp6 [Steccherinum ochraceum]|uniref:ATP-dependent RNA helicase n=1 Tax=Steccherinum ochraceum TaxID=92696 RepID=A0A4R0RF94_9APHY|nr:ATP-dependent RNA helicase dbp6 [Steccherinum ochraceum]